MDKNKKNTNPKMRIDLVMLLKFMILFVILLIPVTFMIVDLASTFIGKQKLQLGPNQNLNADDDFNFDASIEPGNGADISSVPREEIDTLFDNLKK